MTPQRPDAEPPPQGDDPTSAEDVTDSDDDSGDFDTLGPDTQIPEELQTTVDSMLDKMQTLFPSEMHEERKGRARAALEAAFKRANEEYNINTAVKAAGDFQFDKEALARDMTDL
jgi:hypothetical protein